MRTGFILALAFIATGCGLRTAPGKRLPDGGYSGTAEGCNVKAGEGNIVVEPASVPFANINALYFDADGRLYVANRTSSESYIMVFGPSPANDYLSVVGRGGTLRDLVDFVRVPSDGSFWALQDHGGTGVNPEVVHLSAEGSVLSRFPVTTDNVGGIALGPDGSLFVSYYRIAKFDPMGTVLDTFGSKPNGQPFYQGVAWDSSGKLWVTDLMENTLERFDVGSGDRLAKFGGRGTSLGKFDGTQSVHGGPTDLAFDSSGKMYVNDPFGNRIMKLDPQGGSGIGEFKFGSDENIEPIAIDPRTGNVYVGRDNGIDIICPL